VSAWQPIEAYPEIAVFEQPERVLVYGEMGVNPGRVYRYGTGEVIATAEGYHGSEWRITHWMPLPEPPK
jgi:hypothetical protein